MSLQWLCLYKDLLCMLWSNSFGIKWGSFLITEILFLNLKIAFAESDIWNSVFRLGLGDES